MRWLRRSPTVHDPDHIVHLNTKFQLRIPMSAAPQFSLKKVLLFPDDSTTCSSVSSDSSVSSSGRRRVRFYDDVIEFLPSRKILTQDDTNVLWFSRSELSEMKSTFRRIHNRQAEDPSFREAVSDVRYLFSRQCVHFSRDTNDSESLESEFVSHQRRLYKVAAKILGRDDARGLERFHYGKTVTSKSVTKWEHMQSYVATVLETQRLVRDCPPDTRASCIAAKCHSSSSVVWALALADADAEAANAPCEPMKRELLEV